ncbi:uncharacterized protein LOC124496159 [Dermatophagoides farinae]|uniref:Uncharacterized protein n=1 Tax=Dermatophagoides farinae TaxID=6954 RepID=A0A922ICA2_DERFA|nr:uncharacterized protein LOC124496159 [Dermatophagoides farinae]KAH7641044.1 hypothetical protein HUG17_8513 [Dermatophagoides farinae]KAH9526709.1 hypothetical protein DERF_000773 [Dermatophagoides farinae]
MNKELMLIQFSKYMTIGTVSIIIGMIIALIGLWIYSEWLIYQQKKNKQLDIVRDKMDGIEMKRLLRQNSQEQSSHKQKCPDIQIVDLSLENDNPEKEKMISSNRSITQIDSNKRISLKSLDGLPR